MDYPKTPRQAEFIALAEALAGPIAGRADEVDRSGRFPIENFRELHEAGFLGLTIPERFGGLGADPLEYALAIERIARACGSTALAANMHLSLMGKLGETGVWPEETYARVARDIVGRGALLNSANSEPEMGSPSRGGLPTTTATRTPTGWVINGRKRWTSLASALSYMLVLATIVDEGAPRRGNFLAPAETPGIAVLNTWDNLGMRGTGSDDVVFTNVELPLDALVQIDGSAVPGDGNGWAAFGGAAVFLGIAQAARDEAVRFAQTRRPNGMAGPIAELQTIQHRIARIELDLLQARTLLYATAEWWLAHPEERGERAWRLVAAKNTVTNAAIRVTDEALRVSGSAGLAAASPLQRYFRDARTSIGQPPIEDIALTTIGKAALGLLSPPRRPDSDGARPAEPAAAGPRRAD
ncbi:MAG: acyl-CoA/acyl-ACP dehydrogenase [Thermomicrobiales bacterium]|nr:acyl-CoA/acyl-ACP dehydrogenase [Thermomicrobiales bacterium]